MIKPNWKIFEAKFNENPQNYFEWFCYLLFCREYKKQYGIFRFKNQAAIETNPIEIDGNIIGWQAKFYDSALSNYKKDLLTTIEKSKKYYSNITKLIFYTNQEWGQYKGKKPKGLLDIEEKAERLNIILEWRTASFFESDFVSNKNAIITKHFFTFDTSIFDLLEEQQNHNENILSGIKTSINFNNISFEINRDKKLEKLRDQSQKITIVSGVGGVGKTVLIKKLYEDLKDNIPFFIFKATEFELRNINNLFNDYSFYNFVKAYKEKETKIIIIDSAEKLLDLRNKDPFKEFLAELIKDNWKIIFTTRNNYLEQLNYQFFEVYNIAPLNINVKNIELKELNLISDKYEFSLPRDNKLLELIRNPFYLNEYLKYYNPDEELDYIEFKNKLWNKIIRKFKPVRERCFLKIAFERANSGHFFINSSCDANILNELTKEGILGYELAGYFITHDIYEEWALEKIIESEYIKKATNEDFFKKIGHSLPIRRCFRNWISEKLLLEDNDIKIFIEEVFDSDKIESFWKDEIFVSILLSNYSKIFFDIFEKELLANKQELLKRLTFLLRISCKEINEDFFKELGLKNLDIFKLDYVLTKPKGQGWECLIEFAYENIERIGIDNIDFILPIIYDWNSNIKEGKTTRYSSLIALQYYEWVISEDVYLSDDNTKEQLLKTIIYGAAEIKTELKNIFKKIIQNKWKRHRDPYYDFSKFILTKLEGVLVCKYLPNCVIKLADLFWTITPKSEYPFGYSSLDIKSYFGLEEYHLDYFPSSAFQTPIYWLLKFSYNSTVDFILRFTNKSISTYAQSGFDNSVKKVKVYINEENSIKQYVSHCLWNMYRGTSSPISPYLLQSIHMALEKYLLEVGEKINSESLENMLLYLIKNSESASITSIVASIVLAYPEKTFNIAKILFKTKEFILQDTTRLVSEKSTKSLYSLGRNMGSRGNEFYENERIKTCEDKHRKLSLERLFLNYQCFRSEEISEEVAEDRQEVLWNILDDYYQELTDELKENETDKTWRLFLSRMDRRKIKITTELVEKGIEIQFNPKIEPDLQEYSEKALEKSSQLTKHLSLKHWAELKFNDDEDYKKYDKYENDPLLALQEVKDIIEEAEQIGSDDLDNVDYDNQQSYLRINRSIPAYVCSLLIENNMNKLSEKDKEFCKDILIEYAGNSLNPNYRYQISDGVQPAISSLPILLEVFPKEKEIIKTILLFTLFKDDSVGGLVSNASFSIFSINAIHKLWENNFNDAQSLLLGYLFLRPKYDKLQKKIREENFRKGIHELDKEQLMERFFKENEETIKSIIDNSLMFNTKEDISKNNLSILKTAFQMIPQKTDNEVHKEIVQIIVSAFADEILIDSFDKKVNYMVKHEFLEKYSHFVLTSQKEDIPNLLKPFIDKFGTYESIADLFKEFVKAEDKLNTYDNFWLVWNIFKPKVISVCKEAKNSWNINKLIKSYLFAQVPWKEDVKVWHSFKDNNKRFFTEISDKIGHSPSTLYAISKLLNDIGSYYIDDGLKWISNIIGSNKGYINKKLETNTIYYLENFTRNYVFKNQEKIKRKREVRDGLMIILNFLIDKGSSVGYMLRENIL